MSVMIRKSSLKPPTPSSLVCIIGRLQKPPALSASAARQRQRARCTLLSDFRKVNMVKLKEQVSCSVLNQLTVQSRLRLVFHRRFTGFTFHNKALPHPREVHFTLFRSSFAKRRRIYRPLKL